MRVVILGAVLLLAYGGFAGAFVAVMAAVLRRWPLAHRVARAAAVAALLALLLSVGALSVMALAPTLVAPLFAPEALAGEPADRARALAEWISELLNCSVLALPTILIAAVVWGLARRRVRATAAPNER